MSDCNHCKFSEDESARTTFVEFCKNMKITTKDQKQKVLTGMLEEYTDELSFVALTDSHDNNDHLVQAGVEALRHEPYGGNLCSKCYSLLGFINDDKHPTEPEDISAMLTEMVEEMENKRFKLSTESLTQKTQDFVISQDHAVSLLSTLFVLQNEFAITQTNKSHDISPLIVGSTASGKSFLLKTLARFCDLPVITIPATAFTAEGWQGNDIVSFFSQYQTHPNFRYAVVFIDEFDKMGSKFDGGLSSQSEGSFNELKQQRLLTMLEEEDMSFSDPDEGKIHFSTKNMLFVLAGAFQSQVKTDTRKGIGFNQSIESKSITNILSLKDIGKAGFKPELLSRIGTVVQLNELTEADFVSILNHSSDSALTKMQKTFRQFNTELFLTDDAINWVAKESHAVGFGARKLSTTLFGYLQKGIAKATNIAKRNEEYTLTLNKADLVSGTFKFIPKNINMDEKNIKLTCNEAPKLKSRT
jgi:ATP-dependent Clp protease ATP-binding subunit ClpX